MSLSDIDLTNPDNFLNGVPHEWFRRLRREDPVYQHEDPNGPPFWCITTYEDLRYVSRNPLLFSSQERGSTMQELSGDDLNMVRAIMINMDPPQHVKYRRLVQRGFTPQMVAKQEGYLRGLAREIVDKVARKGECEFVEEVASELPLQVICELMGVPQSQRKQIFELTNQLIGFDDPSLNKSMEEAGEAAAGVFGVAMELAKYYQANPADNLTTLLLTKEVEGERLNEMDFCAFFLLLLVAGSETTRTVTVNGFRDLLAHPDQLQMLLDDPSLLPGAIEEILRYEPAVIHFRRTATQDTELRGKKIRKGDKVVMWYPSANRDESVFENPDVFDIKRSPNEHVTFGIGEHFCLGANLARLELQLIFEEVLRRMREPEIVGEPLRLRSNFINGVREMRVRYRPEAA